MDRAVPPQVQSSHFHPRPAHQNEVLGLLSKNTGPLFPLHSVDYASPDCLILPLLSLIQFDSKRGRLLVFFFVSPSFQAHFEGVP